MTEETLRDTERRAREVLEARLVLRNVRHLMSGTEALTISRALDLAEDVPALTAEIRHLQMVAEAPDGSATFIAELRRLRADIEEMKRLRGLLARLEWANCDGCEYGEFCYICGERKPIHDEDGSVITGGHAADCELGQVLSESGHPPASRSAAPPAPRR